VVNIEQKVYHPSMKTFFSSMLILVGIVSSTAHAEVKTVILKPETVFTPKSFDSNDNAQIVLAGVFTGYCMKMGATDFKIDVNEKKIFVRQSASVNGNCMDIDMFIPYSNVLNLGSLPRGDYQVMALQADGTYDEMAMLPIHVNFATKKSLTNPTLTLSGYFTNTCLEFDRVEVNNKGGNVIEVLPLAKVSKSDCKSEPRFFTKSVRLSDFPAKDTLIHVRAMNGQSLNKVITSLDRISR